MHFVLLASHGPEICPISNAKMRDMVVKQAPEIPALAKRLGVNLIAGPFVSHEHLAVIVVESEKAESVHQFILESGMSQWNSIRVVPSVTVEQSMKELNTLKPIF
jgi:hypothetical protein